MPLSVRKVCVLYAIIYSLPLCAATVNASPTAASKVGLPTVGQSHYLGCWQDTDVGEDKHRVTVASDDVATCIPVCWNIRHFYALLKNGKECICTSSMNSLQPSYTTKCTMQCAGNSAYPCGSQDHVSAFHTGKVASFPGREYWCLQEVNIFGGQDHYKGIIVAMRPTTDNTIPVCGVELRCYIPEPDYTIMLDSIPNALMGCYTDYNKRFCRAALSFETSRLSVGMCISMCAEHLAVYAGLEVGTTSRCGDGQSFKCGGTNGYLSIYRTGITVKRPIISPLQKPVWMNSHISKTLVNEIQAYPKNKKAVKDTDPPAKSLAEEIAENREKLNKNAMLAFWVLVILVATAVIFTVACCVCRYALPRFRSSGYQTVPSI